MTISVIIPTRNRINALTRCLESLKNQTVIPDEVVIVGYINDLAIEELIRKLSIEFSLQYIETLGGSCKNRNLGISYATGDVLVFLDDDIILEKNYIRNLVKIFDDKNINIVTGYTFDLVDLTTPHLIREGEMKYISMNKKDEFIAIILNEISIRFPEKLRLLENENKLKFCFLTRRVRNLLKSFILQEWPIKGKILPSGYRSEMPEITKIGFLKEVDWVQGGNFAARKVVLNEFKFNEYMEIFDYALAEDLEFSARVGKKYNIFVSSEMRLLHLRYPGGRVNERQRFKSIAINFYRVAALRGNKFAYSWGIIGLFISRIVKIPINHSSAINEMKGLIDGILILKSPWYKKSC